MNKNRNIFKANEIDSNKKGWIVDLSPANVVDPDFFWRFATRKEAELFNKMIKDGVDAREAAYKAIL